MANSRQAAFRADERHLAVRSYAVTHPAGSRFPLRSVDWDQLVYASRGVMSVHTAEGVWIVPPLRGVWVPARTEHSIRMAGAVTMRSLYFSRRLKRRGPRHCCAVNVTPLLRELILQTVKLGMLRRDVPVQAHLLEVLLDQVEAMPAVPLQLPMPQDRRARRAAELLQTSAGQVLTLEAVGKHAHASRRTLERLFRAETSMSLGRWRQRARLVEALKLLASGMAVTAVALEVGYESPSAFVARFRQELGTTPGRYFAKEGPSPK